METSKDMLITLIEYFRDEMVKTGVQTGFGSPETVRVSQTLDILIIKYQKLLH